MASKEDDDVRHDEAELDSSRPLASTHRPTAYGTPPPRLNARPTPLQTPPFLPTSKTFPGASTSAGPFRTTFETNGHAPQTPVSPLRTSFSSSQARSHGHSRIRSISGPFLPSFSGLPTTTQDSHSLGPSSPTRAMGDVENGHVVGQGKSPRHHTRIHSRNLSMFFPRSGSIAEDPTQQVPEELPGLIPSSSSNSSTNSLASSLSNPSRNPRHHARIHSRNLSTFFPRPGSLPQAAVIAEDDRDHDEAPVSLIPSVGPDGHFGKLSHAFTFGGTHPQVDGPSPPVFNPVPTPRRGHHHKHSLSHNFFSFLEPGDSSSISRTPSPGETTGITSSTSAPAQFASTTSSSTSSPPSSAFPSTYAYRQSTASSSSSADVKVGALTVAAQFCLGAYMWVVGQQVGSLACTGLGYWVVFDAFGVALEWVVPSYLAGSNRARRPYGNARVETVLMFAQSVYLMFSSVYVCKETVEHLLLSAGGGHHHHRGDEDADFLGIELPVYLTIATFLSLIGTAIFYGNHGKLLSITGNRIPSLRALFRSLISRYPNNTPARFSSSPESPFSIILSNPFVACPLFFCSGIMFIATLVPRSQHQPFDLLVAAIGTVGTFKVSFRACVVLGTVLLQTAPQRGLSGGRMEAFLRTMKEIERHPDVLHLPAPHIWQLTPSYTTTTGPAPPLVVTLELHVRREMRDEDVRELTRWAWGRCVDALCGRRAGSASASGMREWEWGEEAEVTVGFVRG